jgi:pyridoxal 5'-phosphate synthase pdxT subunit
MRIGVLSLQGAFKEHVEVLKILGVEVLPIRLPKELDNLDGLIIPGGESTTISRLMLDFGLMQPIRDLAESGLPILGTCAGMVMLAREVPSFNLETLGLMNITVRRNVFGSQVDSFESDLEVPALGQKPFHAIFIRAPVIEKSDSRVEILAELGNGTAVAARQGKLVALAFHPELTGDPRFHRYYLDIVAAG